MPTNPAISMFDITLGADATRPRTKQSRKRNNAAETSSTSGGLLSSAERVLPPQRIRHLRNKGTAPAELDQLRRARRSVAVAGGGRKCLAIRSARGGLANVLITDRHTALRLTEELK